MCLVDHVAQLGTPWQGLLGAALLAAFACLRQVPEALLVCYVFRYHKTLREGHHVLQRVQFLRDAGTRNSRTSYHKQKGPRVTFRWPSLTCRNCCLKSRRTGRPRQFVDRVWGLAEGGTCDMARYVLCVLLAYGECAAAEVT